MSAVLGRLFWRWFGATVELPAGVTTLAGPLRISGRWVRLRGAREGSTLRYPVTFGDAITVEAGAKDVQLINITTLGFRATEPTKRRRWWRR